MFVSEKEARVGYANIISSLSLRLAAVPLWLLNSSRRNCALLVVHSNDILDILLVRVGRGTYVRTMHVYFRATTYVLVAECYHLLLEVINTFSNCFYIVDLNSVDKISFHIFYFFCLFQKKAARVGYANIISSLSLRLAAVPLWLLNPARRDCSLLVVHSNDILNILLVRVGRGTYVRTVNMNLRYPSEVLIAVCYHLLLEVVDTLSHEADFVVLNFVNKISFHVVFVFSCCFVFLFTLQRYCFFLICANF